jgi:hypothetical protein
MYRIGSEAKPMPNEIIVATTIGIQKVFRFNPAARAVVITGAMISATTAGRIPIKIAVKVLLDLMVSGVRKMAMIQRVIFSKFLGWGRVRKI